MEINRCRGEIQCAPDTPTIGARHAGPLLTLETRWIPHHHKDCTGDFGSLISAVVLAMAAAGIVLFATKKIRR